MTARGGPDASSEDKGIARVIEAGHFFPLASLHGVRGGKHTPALAHPANARINESLCLSLQGGSADGLQHHLSLECEQQSVQQLWMGAFKHVAQHL